MSNLDWSEYKLYRYEATSDGRVSIYDRYLRYITTVDTLEQANDYVDRNDAEIRRTLQ